jgi:hypothetical protein
LSACTIENGKPRIVQDIKKIKLAPSFDDIMDLIGKFNAAQSPTQSDEQDQVAYNNPPRMPQKSGQPAKPTSAMLIQKWAGEVKSDNVRTEAIQLMSALRRAAGAINSGTLVGNDLLEQVHAMCDSAMGSGSYPWNHVTDAELKKGKSSWWGNIKKLFGDFQNKKLLNDPNNYANALFHTAQALEDWIRSQASQPGKM